MEQQLAAEQEKRKRAEKDAHALQRMLDHQQSLLERRIKAFKKAPKSVNVASWYRLIIPDSHGSHMDEMAAAALLRDLDYLKPRERIWLGDHLDCGGFLAQNYTWGYVAEANYTFADDVAAANRFIDAVCEKTPRSVEDEYIEGNHERRIERWCITEALRNKKDADYLKDRFGVATQLHLKKRGFNHYEQGKTYFGFSVPATIRKGHCVFTHGSVNARRPACKMLAKFATNVAFGHNHCGDIVHDTLLEKDVMAACCQSLCKRQPMWKHTDPSTWSHGYALQVCLPNGMFLHINVPIVNGQSLLGPLLGQVK